MGNFSYKELDRLEKEAKGIWKIISVNPDSIQIEVSKSILNGKYSVIFKKNQKENEKLNYYIILKMILHIWFVLKKF